MHYQPNVGTKVWIDMYTRTVPGRVVKKNHNGTVRIRYRIDGKTGESNWDPTFIEPR